MNSNNRFLRYFVVFASVSVIVGLTTIAGGQPGVEPSPAVPCPAPSVGNGHVCEQTTQEMQKMLKENPSLVPWLLAQVKSGEDHERELVSNALVGLAPFAAADMIKALRNKDRAVRMGALTYLPNAAISVSFPANDAIRELLAITQDPQEDATFRKLAKSAICAILFYRTQANPPLVPRPNRLAAATVGQPGLN